MFYNHLKLQQPIRLDLVRAVTRQGEAAKISLTTLFHRKRTRNKKLLHWHLREKNRAPNGCTCSAGIAVSTAFRLSVFPLGQRIAEGIIMSTFKELILIGIFLKLIF